MTIERVKNDGLNTYIVFGDVNIEEAMIAMTDNHRGAVAVIDERNKFIGILSDGDVRRALLSGATTFSAVGEYVNMHPFVVHDTAHVLREAEQIFSVNTAITMLPIVNNDNVLTGVFVRNPITKLDS